MEKLFKSQRQTQIVSVKLLSCYLSMEWFKKKKTMKNPIG